MVLERIRDVIQGKPKLEGPSRLPSYFPVEPKKCSYFSQQLFQCLSDEATIKARDMEQAGVHESYFPEVIVKPGDEKAAQKVRDVAESRKGSVESNTKKNIDTKNMEQLPMAGDNPLDECRDAIAYYKRCCDRELKKKHNWILLEPYRVQEEYRYKKKL